MKSKVSFEGVGEVAATFFAESGVKAGQVVKLSGDGTVAACGAGDRFCGVALSVREGCAGVQTGGYAAVNCADSTVTVGYVTLTADVNGGVKKKSADDAGQEFLVVADDGAGIITIKM